MYYGAMQAVILAAGRGTRMKELTDGVPKPMLTVAGRTLLEHKFDVLPEDIEEIILIIGYQGEAIRERFGDSYKGIPLRYIEQEHLDGTMGAVLLAREAIAGPFLVMMGDDLYSTDDIERMVGMTDWAMLVQPAESMGEGGRIITDATGAVTGIEEGDHRGTPGLMNTNLFRLDKRIFEYPLVPKAFGSGEYGLPQTVVAASMAGGIPLHAVSTHDWFQITAPEDLAKAEARFARIEDTAPSV